MICENCGADVPKTYDGADGRKYCCPGCLFHPDGCRCKFGEFGIVDDHSSYDEDFDDDPNEYEPDESTCPDCWHQMSYCVCEEEANAPAVVPEYAEFSDRATDTLLFCPECGQQHIDKPAPDKCQDCGHEREFHFNAGERNVCGGEYIGDVDNCQCDGFVAWLNPPHKKHRCAGCDHVWKPFDYPTNGVEHA